MVRNVAYQAVDDDEFKDAVSNIRRAERECSAALNALVNLGSAPAEVRTEAQSKLREANAQMTSAVAYTVSAAERYIFGTSGAEPKRSRSWLMIQIRLLHWPWRRRGNAFPEFEDIMRQDPLSHSSDIPVG